MSDNNDKTNELVLFEIMSILLPRFKNDHYAMNFVTSR